MGFPLLFSELQFKCMNEITIRFDGGCRPTNPGNKYGSYRVEFLGRLLRHSSQFELGWGTNNEAEFEALLEALKWVRDTLANEGYNAADFSVRLLTDSTILMNRINGRNRANKSEPQQRMFRLSAACLDYLKPFAGFLVHWRSRHENVVVFGH